MKSILKRSISVEEFQLDQTITVSSLSVPCHFINVNSELLAEIAYPVGAGNPAAAYKLQRPYESSDEALVSGNAPRIIAVNNTGGTVGGLPAYTIALEKWNNSYTLKRGDVFTVLGVTNSPPAGNYTIPGSTLTLKGTIHKSEDQDNPEYLDALNAYLTSNEDNLAKNPQFNRWSNGTTVNVTASPGETETADNWTFVFAGTGGALTATRTAFTLGQTEVPGNPEFYGSFNLTSGSSSFTEDRLYCKIPGVETKAGQRVSLGFWIQALAASPVVLVRLRQNFGSGGSPSAEVTTPILVAITSTVSTWTYYEASVILPSVSGKTKGTNGDDYLAIQFTISSLGVVNLANVQLNGGGLCKQFSDPEAADILIPASRLLTSDANRQVVGVDLGSGKGLLTKTGTGNNNLLVRVAPRIVSGTPPRWLSGTTIQMYPTFASDGAGDDFFSRGSAVVLNAGTTGINGLDTGSLANDTWYYLYAIQGSSGSGFVLSTVNQFVSGSITPVSGYTDLVIQLPFAVRTNGSASIRRFEIKGWGSNSPQFVYVQAIGNSLGVGELNVLNAGTATSNTTVSLSTFVPPISRLALLKIEKTNSNTSNDYEVFLRETTDFYTGVIFRGGGGGVVNREDIFVEAPLSATQEIQYRVSNSVASLYLWVQGYTINNYVG